MKQKSKAKRKRTTNQHAQALARLGARKGGQARAASMTPAARSAQARKAARARWGQKRVAA